VDGVLQPAPAPRFSHTHPEAPAYAKGVADNSASIIATWSRADQDKGNAGS
jgi:hypothetical protein